MKPIAVKLIAIKTIGKGVVPDYIQVRDENFVIIAYFRTSNITKGIKELGVKDHDKIQKLIEVFTAIPYGKPTIIQI